jgi:hypothetical protein
MGNLLRSQLFAHYAMRDGTRGKAKNLMTPLSLPVVNALMLLVAILVMPPFVMRPTIRRYSSVRPAVAFPREGGALDPVPSWSASSGLYHSTLTLCSGLIGATDLPGVPLIQPSVSAEATKWRSLTQEHQE